MTQDFEVKESPAKVEKKLVTVYYSSAFGVQKNEGTLVDFGTKQYAQYKDAPFVHFVPKGKRKPTGVRMGYAPYIVIIEGHGHINPPSPFSAPQHAGNGLTTSASTYSCFDDRYKSDFDAQLTEYIQDKVVLMDVRHTANKNVINK